MAVKVYKTNVLTWFIQDGGPGDDGSGGSGGSAAVLSVARMSACLCVRVVREVQVVSQHLSALVTTFVAL